MSTGALAKLYTEIKGFLTPENRSRWHVEGTKNLQHHFCDNNQGSSCIKAQREAINRACGDRVIIRALRDLTTQRTWLTFDGTFCTVCEISSISLCSFFPEWEYLPKDCFAIWSQNRRANSHCESRPDEVIKLTHLLNRVQTEVASDTSSDKPVFVAGLHHLCTCIKEMPARAGCAWLPWSAAASICAELAELEMQRFQNCRQEERSPCNRRLQPSMIGRAAEESEQ